MPGQDQSFFAEYLVANAPSDFEEIVDALLRNEFANFSMIAGVQRCGGRSGMVKRDCQFFRVLYALYPKLRENSGDGSRVVV